MTSKPQRTKGRDGALPTLDAFIQVLNIAKDVCGIPPAQVALDSASVLLTIIRDTMANDRDYVELGRNCGNVCQVLHRKLKGKLLDELNQSVLDAIGDLTGTVTEIQRKVVKQGKRSVFSRLIFAKSNKDKIAAWRQDLVRVLHVFNTELVIDIHSMVADMHRNQGQQGASGKNRSNQASVPVGESPPPSPRDCFGRNGLVEKVVRLAENLEPIALIGSGGIGKTSIALTVLHHNRIKQRFGENRRFIRCDQFPASPAHLLARLSKVIGAEVKNPEDLSPLRPFLSSKEMIIILDNAESILDPKGTSAEEIYSVVDELCQFEKICVCITSRIMTVPPRCERPEIPTLSMEAACDIFYRIYGDRGRSTIINDLLNHLDFHALFITLLATTACHNGWDYDRLAKEWDTQRAQVLQTGYNKSLAATIELSLTSPTFLSLDPDARDLLGVVAFFPQGIDEKNLDWLFAAIPNRQNIFDKFCVLSLTYRSNGFITMLAPIRDYLGPRDPRSSPLLCTTRDRYFSRLSVVLNPGQPGFEEARWVTSEDVNVEHLFDIFTSIEQNGGNIWDACHHFIQHLVWYKPRQTILRSKIEALADDHPSKPKCLMWLSWLYKQIGNHTERKLLLTHTLKLERQRRDDRRIAETLQYLSDVNLFLGLYEEGIRQANEAMQISERVGDTTGQANALKELAFLFLEHKQLEAAENAASRAIDLVPGKGQEYLVCQLHRVLGKIHRFKGDKNKAIHHFNTALEIASPFNWNDHLFWIHYVLADLFLNENEFDDAHAHTERAKSHAVDNTYRLGRAMRMQAGVWYRQRRFKEAKSEALQAVEIFEKFGAATDADHCREFLRLVEQAMGSPSTSFQRAK